MRFKRTLTFAALGLTVSAVAAGQALAGLGVSAAYHGKALHSAHHKGSKNKKGKPSNVALKVITPQPGDRAGAGGVFNIDLSLRAKNAKGNNLLSAANGYVPFFNDVGSPTFGPGMPDPGAPGLVVTLSTTPAMAGGPNANLAGVFQLNAVNRQHGLIQTFNDWQVGVPGFFGQNTQTTLTAYAVRGTAPGVVTPGGPAPITNVVHQTFTIAG